MDFEQFFNDATAGKKFEEYVKCIVIDNYGERSYFEFTKSQYRLMSYLINDIEVLGEYELISLDTGEIEFERI